MSNPIERFAEALEREGRAEKAAAREAARLEPITIVISDQEELKRIHEILALLRYKERAVPMIRGHLRGWSRELLSRMRAERGSSPNIAVLTAA